MVDNSKHIALHQKQNGQQLLIEVNRANFLVNTSLDILVLGIAILIINLIIILG